MTPGEDPGAAGSAWLHALHLAGLGGAGVLPSCGLSVALERAFGSRFVNGGIEACRSAGLALPAKEQTP